MKSTATFAGAAVLALCSGSQAIIIIDDGQAIPFSAWQADGQMQIFDKIFTFESYTSAHLQASDISIGGVVKNSDTPGKLVDVGFDLFFGLGDVPGDPIVSEFNLQYNVTLLPDYVAQGWRITDSKLQFNGSAFGNGSFARVDESINDFFDVNVGNLSVYAIAGQPAVFSDQIIWGLPGYTYLEVNKDVKVFANGADDAASMSFVREVFSQVPTPGAASLFGVAALAGVRRRR